MGTTARMRTCPSPRQPQYVSVRDEVICYADRCHGYNPERALRKSASRRMTQGGGVAAPRAAKQAACCSRSRERREDGGCVERRRCWVRRGRDYTLCPSDPRSYGLPEPSPAVPRGLSQRHGRRVHHEPRPHVLCRQAPSSPSGPLRNRADHRQGEFRGRETRHAHHH